MKVTYTKVDGRIFSIYTEKLSDIEALLLNANIQHIECFFVTQREKQTLCKFFEKKYYVQNLDFMRSLKVYKKK
jgi:hypothetical protein